jgi:rhamnosyltransferase
MDSIFNQEFDHPFELIFMDNNSKDGTVQYLNQLDFPHKRIIHVPEGHFSHSGTRMEAARIAQGKYVIFFTDDIIPIGNHFLTELTRPVLEKKAPATYGVFQVDPRTSDPIDAYLHNGWYRDIDDVVEPISRFCWDKFTPVLRRRLSNFDNCSSCIELKTLLEMTFPDVPYGEDMLFAKQLILNGQPVAISKKAKFYHWHKVSFSYLLKRMCIDQYLSIQEYGVFYVRRKAGVVKAILIRVMHRTMIALTQLKIPVGQKIYWSIYNIKTLTADFIGKYIGVLTRDSARGFSPLNRRLLKKKGEIINQVYTSSIKRY